jgi:hypothetical protein
MADVHAVRGLTEAVMKLLEQSYRNDLIEPGLALKFEVYQAPQFQTPPTSGLTLFLYRVGASRIQSSGPGVQENGQQRRRSLPLDLHFFLTVWAKTATLQHAILGWAMRVLADFPLLPAPVLNAARDGTYRDDESVELVPDQLDTEEMMRIWDSFGVPYQLSVPYLARVVRIDSELDEATYGEVLRRRFRTGELVE